MKPQVIGFEGSRDRDSPVSWGVAAIALDEVIINAETRHQTPLEDLDGLVAEGHLTRFNSAIQIDKRASELPLVVVELARIDPVFPFLAADTGRIGGLVAHSHGRDFVVYVFENQDSLDLYARDAATKIAHALLSESWAEDEAPARLLRAGLILAANHPALNALHVARVTEARRSRAREIALAAIAGDNEADAFDDLLDALIAHKPTNIARPTTAAKKKPLSKSDVLNAIADAVGEEVPRKQVKAVVEALVAVGHKELKKNGVFVLHGFAKFVVVKKPARPARKGISAFTKQEQTSAAKAASKAVRARPVKAAKDAVG